MNFEDLKTKKSTYGKLFGRKKNTKKYWAPDVRSRVPHRNIIRFLPPHKDNEYPIYPFHTHTLSYEGKYKTIICTKDKFGTCPVCDFITWVDGLGIKNNNIYNSLFTMRRTAKYVANIFVIEDQRNPDNNSGVFIYRFGSKIFDKIQSFIEAEEDEIDIFNFWEGYDFILRVEFSGVFPNYDKSNFRTKPSILNNYNDTDLKKVWNSEYDLEKEITPKDLKSVEDEFFNFFNSNNKEQVLCSIGGIKEEDLLSFINFDVEVSEPKDSGDSEEESPTEYNVNSYYGDDEFEESSVEDSVIDVEELDEIPF